MPFYTIENDYTRAFDETYPGWRDGAPLVPLKPVPELTTFHTACEYGGGKARSLRLSRARRAGLPLRSKRALQAWWDEAEKFKRTGSSLARARVLIAAEAVVANGPLPNPDEVVAFHRNFIEQLHARNRAWRRKAARSKRYMKRCERRGEAWPYNPVWL